MASPPTVARPWVAGARPRTLPAAVVPVAVGFAAAHSIGPISWWRGFFALVVSLAIQIGTNYANDYSDGIRGTDAERVGPVRLVAGGLKPAREVRRAAMIAYGVAMVAGLVLSLTTSPWLLLLGAASIAAGWFYTGGPRPYGYAGFGELFVFAFFGLAAVLGTCYVAAGHLSAAAIAASVPVGLLAVALLVVNNLRDIPGDSRSGKRTLAVRIGAPATRRLYVGCIGVAFVGVLVVAPFRIGALLALLAVLAAIGPVRRVVDGASGGDLVPVLALTGRLQLAFGALLAIGIAL